jgi:hypothetical protein
MPVKRAKLTAQSWVDVMPLHWRPPGARMGTVDLRELRNDQIVIHFGGAVRSVDAYTFGNSLLSFADTIRAVNAVINPEQNIEVRLEPVGPGSFRALIKSMRKGLGGFFSRSAEGILFGVIATLLVEYGIKPDAKMTVTFNTDEVIIEKNGDRIIVPREVYERMGDVKKNPEVQKHVRRTFEVIEDDPAIDNFGLTPSIDDPEPLVQIPREEFPRLASLPIETVLQDTERTRERAERARLVILKAWFTRGNRKWLFEWNGVPLSAPIKDETFWDRLENREILIGQGDALDVEISYRQEYEASIGVFVNDPGSFKITRVFGAIPRQRDGILRFD